jgi:hypothetical protein
MAERVPFPTTVDGEAYTEADLTWAEDPGANAVTKPATARFEDGYFEGTGSDDGSTIPAEEHNSLFSWWMMLFAWLKDFVAREWAEMSEGIGATSAPERFIVHAPAAGMRALMSEAYSQQGPTGAYTVKALCGDGEQLYVAQENSGGLIDTVYNLDPTDGQPPSSGSWSQAFSAAGSGVAQMFADGTWLWVAMSHTTAPGLKRVDPSDGSYTNYTNHGSNDVDLVAGNGSRVICVDDTNVLRAHVYQVGGTYDGYLTFGAADTKTPDSIYAVCCVGDLGVLVGADTSANEWYLETFIISTRTSVGFTTLAMTVADVTEAVVVSDGRRIYVGHNQSTLAGTACTVSAYAISGLDFLWGYDSGATATAGIWVDDMWLYIGEAANTLLIDKATGQRLLKSDAPAVQCGDGVSWFGIDTNNVERLWTGRPSMEFMRCAAGDGNRLPWPGMLAQPTGRNL